MAVQHIHFGRAGSQVAAGFVLMLACLAQLSLPALPPFIFLYPSVIVCTYLGGVLTGGLSVIVGIAFTLTRLGYVAGLGAIGGWDIAALVGFAIGAGLSVTLVGAYQRTARLARQERQRLQVALRAARAAVWEIDSQGRLFWDENFYRLVGLDPHTTPPTTEAFLSMVDPEDRPRMAAARRAIDAGEEPNAVDEYRLHRPDGQTIWLANHRSRVGEAGIHYIGITQDITRRKEAENRVVVLLREAAHRAKNQFAVIQAIARETSRSANVNEAFYNAFVERLRALAKTHDLLAMGRWEGTQLHELLVAHWEAFGVESRCHHEGAPISITPAAAQQLGMAFHELTTNSIKHGALRSGGEIFVQWSIGHDGDLSLAWRETGLVGEPQLGSGGFGMRVLRELVPFALLGESSFELLGGDLVWHLRTPLQAVVGQS